MNTDKPHKLTAMVGFAIRSRKIELGTDAILAAGSKAKAVFADTDLSENAKKKLRAVCEKRGIPYSECSFKEQFTLPAEGCKAFALTDKNMVRGILSEIQKD